MQKLLLTISTIFAKHLIFFCFFCLVHILLPVVYIVKYRLHFRKLHFLYLSNCRFFNNAYYAKVGGINTIEMNRLELNFLFSLDFRLRVDLETFRKYCLQLEKEATVSNLERTIQVCRLDDWSTVEDSKCQPAVQRYSCGAV